MKNLLNMVPAQAWRFLRLAAFALLSSSVVPDIVNGQANRQVVIAAVVAACEVAFRQMVPASKDGVSYEGAVLLVRLEVNRLLRAIVSHGQSTPSTTEGTAPATPAQGTSDGPAAPSK